MGSTVEQRAAGNSEVSAGGSSFSIVAEDSTDLPQAQVVPREENTEAAVQISLTLSESSIAMVSEATIWQHDQRASKTQREAAAIETELD